MDELADHGETGSNELYNRTVDNPRILARSALAVRFSDAANVNQGFLKISSGSRMNCDVIIKLFFTGVLALMVKSVFI